MIYFVRMELFKELPGFQAEKMISADPNKARKNFQTSDRIWKKEDKKKGINLDFREGGYIN